MGSNNSEIRKINILGDLLFPLQFQFLGMLLLLGGLVVLTLNIYVGPILILVALLIFTGRDGVVFYPAQRMYKDYRSFLFIKTGKKKPYSTIEKLFINEGHYNQKMYTMHTSQHIKLKSVEYNVYALLDNGTKLYLGYGKDKMKIMMRFTKIAGMLNAPLQDHTD